MPVLVLRCTVLSFVLAINEVGELTAHAHWEAFVNKGAVDCEGASVALSISKSHQLFGSQSCSEVTKEDMAVTGPCMYNHEPEVW